MKIYRLEKWSHSDGRHGWRLYHHDEIIGGADHTQMFVLRQAARKEWKKRSLEEMDRDRLSPAPIYAGESQQHYRKRVRLFMENHYEQARAWRRLADET